jgi:hypothetical protein
LHKVYRWDSQAIFKVTNSSSSSSTGTTTAARSESAVPI